MQSPQQHPLQTSTNRVDLLDDLSWRIFFHYIFTHPSAISNAQDSEYHLIETMISCILSHGKNLPNIHCNRDAAFVAMALEKMVHVVNNITEEVRKRNCMEPTHEGNQSNSIESSNTITCSNSNKYFELFLRNHSKL